MKKEALARIKINNLLEDSGWRFFDNEDDPANIALESNAKITKTVIDELGEDFEKTKNGYIDFLLLDENKFPILVLEAKREELNPLVGKEQARKYARGKNVRFIILSNGNIHYFWDTEKGNPEIITEFPRLDSLKHRKDYEPDISKIADEVVGDDYIAISQMPDYKDDPDWQNEQGRSRLMDEKGLRFLRPYQLKAIHALQDTSKEGKERYLFEMATGTGKTLVSAAVIKLFLRTGNAKRILFLVDRLELENQAYKNFVRYLKNDYTTVIYKENKNDWNNAEIVVTTIQSLSSQNKYKKLFSPTDFDLVISDESHRSIGGNSRAVFEYFIGYKLGLTATPKDYLKNIDPEKLNQKDPRAWERRQLLDTYTTFGCESGTPTYRYSLVDGVKEGYLVSPIVVDARTDITTDLLSEKGYAVMIEDEDGKQEEEIFYHTAFERKFFSDKTNKVFCKTFLENALRDPISGEIGKSIIFCVSQTHATKITQILNKSAHQLFPDKYNSDFAIQITSQVANAQEHTINFVNNNLLGQTNWLEGYKSSRARVCITVGMMTTGYDCQDILNLALMRPVFSPTDFVQIKGRGTRKFNFEYKKEDGEKAKAEKVNFKMFDFFANCEYFEEKFDYDEIIKLPQLVKGAEGGGGGGGVVMDEAIVFDPDKIKQMSETAIGAEGMKIDRKLFEKFEEAMKDDKFVKAKYEEGDIEAVEDYIKQDIFEKPEEYFNLGKLRKALKLDRRISLREILDKVFGNIDKFKTRDEMLEEECEKFISINKPESKYVPYIKNFIKSYITDEKFRTIIENKEFTELHFYPAFSVDEFKAMNGWKELVPEYIKDYISINQYL